MGLFRSEEEKAAAAAARAEEDRLEGLRRQEANNERVRQQWLASPVGGAEAALAAGERFYEVQLAVNAQERDAMFGDRRYAATGQVTSAATTLGQIEALGWRLEHVGYVYQVTGQSSSSRVFVSGEDTAVSGVTVGIYLFRNPAFA